jgi:hypothetical protein
MTGTEADEDRDVQHQQREMAVAEAVRLAARGRWI